MSIQEAFSECSVPGIALDPWGAEMKGPLSLCGGGYGLLGDTDRGIHTHISKPHGNMVGQTFLLGFL